MNHHLKQFTFGGPTFTKYTAFRNGTLPLWEIFMEGGQPIAMEKEERQDYYAESLRKQP